MQWTSRLDIGLGHQAVPFTLQPLHIEQFGRRPHRLVDWDRKTDALCSGPHGDHFGNVFGANLNRKDVIQFSSDNALAELVKTEEEKRMEKLISKAKTHEALENLRDHLTENLQNQFNEKWNSLT